MTHVQLKGVVRDRLTWHSMRVEDLEEGEPEVAPALLAPIQVRVARCVRVCIATPSSMKQGTLTSALHPPTGTRDWRCDYRRQGCR